MCGRFTQELDGGELADLYDLEPGEPLPALRSRWNGAPTQTFAVCRNAPGGRQRLALHRWGLVPAWSRDPKIGGRLINARSETVDDKPAFRSAARKRRCLVPANGWFEWQPVTGGKQPWWIAPEGGPFSFAGLWDVWDRGAAPIVSFTILTCPSSEALGAIHHRQPAIVPRERYRDWLDPEFPLPDLLDLVREPHAGPFELRRVSRAVNRVANDSPEILRPV